MTGRVHFLDSSGQIPGQADTVVIPGSSLGGPAAFNDALLEKFIEIERRGLHIILLAGSREDLDTAVAELCRRVYVSDPEIQIAAEEKWGTEQVIVGKNDAGSNVKTALLRLPTPASRTIGRRVQQWLRRKGIVK